MPDVGFIIAEVKADDVHSRTVECANGLVQLLNQTIVVQGSRTVRVELVAPHLATYKGRVLIAPTEGEITGMQFSSTGGGDHARLRATTPQAVVFYFSRYEWEIHYHPLPVKSG